ncbi:unnamed protein product [Moneuplotes crassus]|uniref:Protein kinase domain-containing protein n=1 Tax=Euplotes crassus TaxID=5936 RepID=A0AAD1Y267_EUPCR|nr:unnamed protein product [Moneuplotes crassus]
MIAAQDKTIHPISFVIALVTMKQISKILKIMHKYKIFHGNLRPSNIIFQEEKNWNSLKITGFESACILAENHNFDKKFEEINAGEDYYSTMNIYTEVRKKFDLEEVNDSSSKLYYAPELAKGGPSNTSDIWSAGIIFYQMLSREHPFENLVHLDFNDYAIKLEMRSHEENFLNFDNTLFLESPQEILDLISKMLVFDASKRISAKKLKEEIKNLSHQYSSRIKQEVPKGIKKSKSKTAQSKSTAHDTSVRKIYDEPDSDKEPLFKQKQGQKSSKREHQNSHIDLKGADQIRDKHSGEGISEDHDDQHSDIYSDSDSESETEEELARNYHEKSSTQTDQIDSRKNKNHQKAQIAPNHARNDTIDRMDIEDRNLEMNDFVKELLMKGDPGLYEKVEEMKDYEDTTLSKSTKHSSKKIIYNDKTQERDQRSISNIYEDPIVSGNETDPLKELKAINLDYKKSSEDSILVSEKDPIKKANTGIKERYQKLTQAKSDESSIEQIIEPSADESIDPSDISEDKQPSRSSTEYRVHAKLIIYATCATTLASDSKIEKIQKRFLRVGEKQENVDKNIILTYFGKKVIECETIDDDTKDTIIGFLAAKESYDSITFIQDYLALDYFLEPNEKFCTKIFDSICQGKSKLNKSALKTIFNGRLEVLYPEKDKKHIIKAQKKILKMISSKDKKFSKEDFVSFMLK